MPAFVQTVQFRAVEGLTAADAASFLHQRGISLAPDLLTTLHGQTQGNAQLLSLAAELLCRAADPATVITYLSQQQDVERFIIRQVDASLSDDERAILSAMSILLGYPATRAALSALLNRGGLQRSIQSLTDRHLLTVQETAQARMFGLHAMLRSFYDADLGADERKLLHRRAAQFYEKDEPDLLRAVEHWLRAGERDQAATLATSDVWAFINRGQAHALLRLLDQFTGAPLSDVQQTRLILTRGEIQHFDRASEAAQASYTQALALAERLPAAKARQQLLAAVCRRLGELLADQDPDQAQTWLQRGLEEAGDDDAAERAALWVTMGSALIAAGNYTAADDAVQAGLRVAPTIPDQLFIRAQLNLGVIASERGDLSAAIENTSQAWARAALTHDESARLVAEMNLGVYAFTYGDWDGAVDKFTTANLLAARVGSGAQRTELAINLGYLLLRRGDDAEAGMQLQAALALARQNHLTRHEIAGLINLAEWQQRRGELEKAQELVAAAQQLALTTHISGYLPEIYRRRAQIGLAAGDAAGALNAIAQSLTEAADMPLERGISLRVQGRALVASGDLGAAAEAFAHSLELLTGADPYEAARTQLAWARLRLASGDEQGAQILFDAAAQTFARLGAQRDLEETLQARRQS